MSVMNGLARVSGAVGKGLLAGLVGTLAITASQTIEMKITGREDSETPAKAVEEIFDIEPESEAAEKELSTLAHFGYGTAWGAFRGLLGACGIKGPLATVLHFAAISGAAMVMLPQLKLAPPPTKEKPRQLAMESLHHAVYAIAAGVTFDALDADED